LLRVSLLLNAGLLLAGGVGYAAYRFEKIWWETEAPPWAGYAGSMQAGADFGNDVRRYYRLTAATSAGDRATDTGERDGVAEIWTWPYYPSLGDASRASNAAFVDSYNRRMRHLMAGPATRPNDGAIPEV
jgi:hypothetical protein